MNKVITINLNGNAYQLEEGGYDALRAYLETAAARLSGNPDRDEIISDIERAIAEKFRALLTSYKTVVVVKEVTIVLAAMGPIEADPGKATDSDANGASAPDHAQTTAGHHGPPKRLYRIQEGAMIAGVCNGIATYMNIDPTLVRIAFVILTSFWFSGLLVYVVMAIVVPEARSPEEKAAASGDPATAQEFIRRAKEGYYDAIKNFPDRKTRREWKRRFRREMHENSNQWRYNWQSYWMAHTPSYAGASLALPLFSLLYGAVKVLWICALISLLATGAVFGLALPVNLPLWGAALLLFGVYGIIACPLKAARRSCYCGSGRPILAWSFVFFLDAMVWFLVVAALLWMAVHYSSELRDAVHQLPVLAHQAADDIRTWWQGM